MKNHITTIITLGMALCFLAPCAANAEESNATFEALLSPSVDVEAEWSESQAVGRVAQLKRLVENLRGEAEEDLSRQFYSMAEQRYRRLAETLQEEISLLEVISYDAGTESVRERASERLSDAGRERDGAVEMVQLLALR